MSHVRLKPGDTYKDAVVGPNHPLYWQWKSELASIGFDTNEVFEITVFEDDDKIVFAEVDVYFKIRDANKRGVM